MLSFSPSPLFFHKHHPPIIAENIYKIPWGPQHNQQVDANTLLCYPINYFHVINEFNNNNKQTQLFIYQDGKYSRVLCSITASQGKMREATAASAMLPSFFLFINLDAMHACTWKYISWDLYINYMNMQIC